MKTSTILTDVSRIKYHADKVKDSLEELGDITGWEARALAEDENVQYDKEEKHGPSMLHFAISITTAIRTWAEITISSLKQKEEDESIWEKKANEKHPWYQQLGREFLNMIGMGEEEEEIITSDEFSQSENEILIALEDLRTYFTKEKLREKLLEVLQFIDECDFDREKKSEKGNPILKVIEATSVSISSLVNSLLKDKLVIHLEDSLNDGYDTEDERTEEMSVEIEKIRSQLKLLRWQEAYLGLKASLYDAIADYGRFSPSRGIFEEIIDELLLDTEIPDKPASMQQFYEQLPKLGVTIVNPEEIESLTAIFRALVKTHYHKVALLTGVTPDRVDVGMIME